MAGSSKKQGGKKKTSKKTVTSDTAKKSKKPATFSKAATTKKKTTSKKSLNKIEKEIPKEVVEEIKKDVDFAEFETLKLVEPNKPEPKIILRDVTREIPIGPIAERKEVAIPKEQKIFTAIEPRPQPKITAKKIKEQEIEKAIKTAAKLPVDDTNIRQRRSSFGEFGWKRAFLATFCVVITMLGIVYLVNATSTDMSLKNAAAQSGINAVYPSYIPRGYSLSDVTSSSGKVNMHFKGSEGAFSIIEEVSNWDSEALLNNYIKPTYKNDYTVIREQGLTLFMGDNWEAWVNGGVLYKLTIEEGSLTKKQMDSIATSF